MKIKLCLNERKKKGKRIMLLRRDWTPVEIFVVLLIIGLVVAIILGANGTCTPRMESTENVLELRLPDDFSEWIGDPSFIDCWIYITYLNNNGESISQRYYDGGVRPERIRWVKPEGVKGD